MPTAVEREVAVAPLFPGIVTRHLAATCMFYAENFGFQRAPAHGDFVLLLGPDGQSLGLRPAGGADQPAALRDPTRGTGLWLQAEVDDLAALHARWSSAGVEIVADPACAADGTRCCIVRDPNGV